MLYHERLVAASLYPHFDAPVVGFAYFTHNIINLRRLKWLN